MGVLTNCLSVFDHFVKSALKGLTHFVPMFPFISMVTSINTAKYRKKWNYLPRNRFTNGILEAYLEPSQTSTMELFAKIVNSIPPEIIRNPKPMVL